MKLFLIDRVCGERWEGDEVIKGQKKGRKKAKDEDTKELIPC
jgi:hypothetical protein